MQDLGETVFEAAVREAREETGLDVMPLGIVTVIDGITHDAKGKVEFHYTIVEVAAESREGEAERAISDALEVRWATIEEVGETGTAAGRRSHASRGFRQYRGYYEQRRHYRARYSCGVKPADGTENVASS